MLGHNIGTWQIQFRDAQWYGINSHLYYDLKDNLSIGMRAEWFVIRTVFGFALLDA